VAFGGWLRTYDVRDSLHRITAPTLVIAGRHDWICPPEFSEEIAQRIPQADLRIFEHSGHSVRVDEPEALLDAIAGFMVYQQ
jgi:proline iminopeptidase